MKKTKEKAAVPREVRFFRVGGFVFSYGGWFEKPCVSLILFLSAFKD